MVSDGLRAVLELLFRFVRRWHLPLLDVLGDYQRRVHILHIRQLVVRCKRFGLHELHRVSGRHVQSEWLVFLDCGHDSVHKLRGGLLLEHDQRSVVHELPDGHGLPGLHDDGPEHVRLRRGLRVERQRVCRLHGR